MLSSAVVERLNVIEGVCDGLRSRVVVGAMHPLVLVAVEETLRRGIVPAVPFAAHRTDHAVFAELDGVGCIDHLADLRWAIKERDDPLPVTPPGLANGQAFIVLVMFQCVLTIR